MRHQTVLMACFCSAIAVISAVPVPANSNQELDVLQIPLSNGKELDVLTLGTAEQLSDRNKRTIGLLRELFPDITKQNGEAASIDLEALNKQLEETIRVARQATEGDGADAEQKLTLTNEVQTSSSSANRKSDQQASESKAPALDELNLDSNEDTADVDDRNKRFLTLGATSGGADGANKGNSGNFLFDIIRLFSGSVQTQTGDEAANAPSSSGDSDSTDSNDTDSSRTEDGYTEGIPGPVTRLVVLANRGLANLIQDLILRIAATSERLVNFKARLITALI